MNDTGHKYLAYLGFPVYSNGSRWIAHNLANVGAPVAWEVNSMSLLARNFNRLMAHAYNKREEFGHEYFCLIHDDIEIITPNWLQVMVGLMRQHKIDVLGVVSPIKTRGGITSIALDVDEQHSNIRRLTLEEIKRLPETFTPEDTKRVFGSNRLLINTGLLLIRMKAVDPTKHFFECRDKIIKLDGSFVDVGVSEDWLFSRLLLHDAISYGATSAITIRHHGNYMWTNKDEIVKEIENE